MKNFLKGLWRLAVLSLAAVFPLCLLLLPAKAWGPLSAALWEPQTSVAEAEILPTGVDKAEQQPPETENTVPQKKQGGGTVVEEVLCGGIRLADNLYYKNRDGLSVNFAAFLNKTPQTVLETGAAPQVLILHTHTTESYMSYYAGYYNTEDFGRSTDAAQNVTVAGEALAAALRAKGIAVVHDVTVHDSPQYTGAYARSAETAAAVRKKYPSVKLVIDLHRDAVQRSEAVAVKPTVTVGGESYAQMMFVVGGENTKDNPNAYRDENVTIALALQQELQARVPNLMRPISFCACEYNQSLWPGLLVEVGAQANTFAEAARSATVLGEAIAAVLSE